MSVWGTVGHAACRDCAQPAFGGPAENRFTPYDALCRGEACRDAGFPQVFVNTANLTLFVRVTDLVFGGTPAFTLEHSFNGDDTRSGALGAGWSFSLGDTIITDPDGSLVVRRGSGRTDRFATAAGSSDLFPVTNTTDSLSRAADGTYTLRAGTSATTRLFSSDGKLLSIRDGAAVRVSLDYDSSGYLAAAHYRGKTIAFTTDSAGRLTSIKDAAGRTVSFTYDSDGRLAQETGADGQTTTYEYFEGNVSSVTRGGGKTVISYGGIRMGPDYGYFSVATVTTLDAAVRLYDTPRNPTEIRVTDGNGDVTWYTSTALGLLQSTVDSAGNTISYAYDAAGNRIRATNGAGETTSFTYDSRNNLTGVTDGNNNRWTAAYSTGVTRITDPNKNVWVLNYDDNGNLSAVSDPRTFTINAARNAAGQITTLSDQKGNARNYQYNADGLLTGFTDALGNKWTYDYDGAARTSVKTDPTGATLKVDYTTGNRIARIVSGDTQTPFDYSGIQRDSLNRLTRYTDSSGLQLTYTYDAAGQLTAITMPGDKTGAYQVAYQYDHLHRLSRVSDWQGNFALYRYDAAGWPVSLSVSGGPVTIYQYDGARNLRAVVSTGPDGTPVAGYRYSVDASGNRIAVSALEPGGAALSLTGTGTFTYTFDAANRPISRSDGVTYRYDARSNLTAIEAAENTAFSYDAIGRLSGLSGAAAGSYGYDSTGLRSLRNGRRLVYDLSTGRPRVVMETDSSNAPVAWYVYGLGLLWKVTPDGATYFYHFDGDGNTVALSNPSAGVVNTYRYDPMGRLLTFKEGVENSFRARGELGWVDDGNGLLFTGSQFYFPALRLTLPGTPDVSPPAPDLQPRLSGPVACFIEGVAQCLTATGRGIR